MRVYRHLADHSRFAVWITVDPVKRDYSMGQGQGHRTAILRNLLNLSLVPTHNSPRATQCDLSLVICALRIGLLPIQKQATFPFPLREVRLGRLQAREATMKRRRSSTSRRSVRLDPVTQALSILRATVHVVGVFGDMDLLAILLSLGGGFQLAVSQRLVV